MEFDVVCTKTVGTYFTKDQMYNAKLSEIGNIYTIDNWEDEHIIANGTHGGLEDEWFLTHFEVKN